MKKKSVKTKKSAPAKRRASRKTPKVTGRSKLRAIFEGAGFQRIRSEKIEFALEGRRSEIDYIFVHENVVVLCEETGGSANLSDHFSKKRLFHQIIDEDTEASIGVCAEHIPELSRYLHHSRYRIAELEVRHLYYSENADVDEGLRRHARPFRILSRSHARYFLDLVKTIKRSAIYELLKYLGVTLSQVGEAAVSGKEVETDQFKCFVLSDAHTNFPKDFVVVSFYVHPEALLSRAYVLRRDGWERPEVSYQRFVRRSKLASIRKYLAEDGKVFTNNLIVTLPPTVQLKDKSTERIISAANLPKKTEAILSLPNELGTVGIVDGQHRIFAYYDGEPYESQIADARLRQNLLVTGIVFPAWYGEERRVKFEAELFLKINNTQTSVRTDLRQELETIINPASALALAKSVVSEIAQKGPLKGLLQATLNDGLGKIRTSSLVKYVFLPLVKPEASNLLYRSWVRGRERDLKNADIRREYVLYCATYVNQLLIGAKLNLRREQWAVNRWNERQGVLSTATVGGLVMCLRDIIASGQSFKTLNYEARFKGLDEFRFNAYTSSHWAAMGAGLWGAYFSSAKRKSSKRKTVRTRKL